MNAPMKTVVPEPEALLVFVDRASARLISLGPSGGGHEVRLESEVDGHGGAPEISAITAT